MSHWFFTSNVDEAEFNKIIQEIDGPEEPEDESEEESEDKPEIGSEDRSEDGSE